MCPNLSDFNNISYNAAQAKGSVMSPSNDGRWWACAQ